MFRTPIEIPSSPFRISYSDHIMTLGSCFAENMGKKMSEVYFEIDVNPFGVLYNPVSIRNSIELLLQNKPFTTEDIFEDHSLWLSLSHSSLFSDSSQEGCLNKINARLVPAGKLLRKTDFLLITFGTAWVFEEKKSGRVVSNCHKLPASRFVHRRLTVEEIVSDFSELLLKLHTQLPSLGIIFSVSPIRHWKDGAHENTLSKSILHLAIDALQKQFNNVHYFPAYEIQLDELRDYRFYAADMQHPSEVAADYIWERFCNTYFSTDTLVIKKRLEQLSTDLAHRPLHPDSVEYNNFLDKLKQRKAEIKADYPFLSDRIK